MRATTKAGVSNPSAAPTSTTTAHRRIACNATRRDSLIALGAGAGGILLPGAGGGVANAADAANAAARSAYDFDLPQYGASVSLRDRYAGKVVAFLNIASA